MSKFFAKYVFVKDGELDLDQASQEFQKDLLAYWESEMRLMKSVIGLFQKFPGANLNIPYIVSSICTELGVTPESYPSMSKKVEETIHSLEKSGVIKINKGKGGGCSLVSASK